MSVGVGALDNPKIFITRDAEYVVPYYLVSSKT